MPTIDPRKVRIDDCELPDPSVTILGPSDHEIPDGLVEFVRLIVPEKLLRLDSRIVAVPVEPTFTCITGDEAMLKSTIRTAIVV